MSLANRTSDFYFSDDQLQFNHDLRVWICGAEVTQHLRGTLTLRRGDREGPSTLQFELDNVKDIFTITAANKGYIDNPDGTYSKNENSPIVPLDNSLSDEVKKKIDKIYDEINSCDSELQDLSVAHEKNKKGIEEKYEKEIKEATKKQIQAAVKEQQKIVDDLRIKINKTIPDEKTAALKNEDEKYETKKTELEKKKQVAQSRLNKLNIKRTTNADGSKFYGTEGDFGRNNETSSTTSISKEHKVTEGNGKKAKTKLVSEELIFNFDNSLQNEDVYSDAAKKLIYTNKTILNANINVGNFLKTNGLGFNPYDLNIDTPIIEKHDPIRVFIKDPSKPFLTNTLDKTDSNHWIPMFTGFIDAVTDHTDYINGDKFLSVSCYDIRGMMQRMRVMTNPRISRGTDNAVQRAEQAKKFSVNTGYFTDFFAQGGMWGEKSTKYLHYAFDQVCLDFLTGRWNKYNSFAEQYVGKVLSSQSNEILENKEMIEHINLNLINDNGKVTSTEPSKNGIGTFIPGIIIECPNYKDNPDACKRVMELWYDILVFGVKATYYTKEEMERIGNNTLPYGEFDPYNCFVHMITPPGGTKAKELFDSQLEDLQTGFDYTNRFEFFTKLVTTLDYQWFTNSMGDIVIEFPMYDFEPSVFGKYKSNLTINKHLNNCTINEVANTVFSAVSASGGISSIVGGVWQPAQFIFSAFAKSDQLAYKYGININEFSAPQLKTNTNASKLRTQAIIELIKCNMQVSSMEMDIAYRFAIFPNKPIYNVPKHRMATITGFSYTMQINESVSCTIDSAMVKKMDENNKFINIYNSTNTPIHYNGDNTIELTDASIDGIDSFYIDSDNKPTNTAPAPKQK